MTVKSELYIKQLIPIQTRPAYFPIPRT